MDVSNQLVSAVQLTKQSENSKYILLYFVATPAVN